MLRAGLSLQHMFNPGTRIEIDTRKDDRDLYTCDILESRKFRASGITDLDGSGGVESVQNV